MEERTKFHMGLDVHKDSISIAAAELGRAPARLVGKVTQNLIKLLKVLTRIGTAEHLHRVAATMNQTHIRGLVTSTSSEASRDQGY